MAALQTPWYNKTVEALQLNGKGEQTQQSYARAVRMLIEFHGKDPDQITEEELKAYFLHRKNVDHWAPNTLRIAYCAIKFFYLHVVRRDWHILDILKAQTERRLPAVLTREEIDSIFQQINTFHNYVFLTTVYSCGLRLQEALYLETGDIDARRRVIHVHRGKGAKDRYVPLPDDTVRLMRQHWKTHRNPKLIFLALGRGHNLGPNSTTPMAIDSVQGAFRKAKFKAGIAKKRVSVHTLRHSFASHLLQANYDIRTIQELLGHSDVRTTMIYTHTLRSKTIKEAKSPLDF